MRGSNFSYLVRKGITSVWHNRMMSFASFCIIMVSLLLIGVSVLISLDIGVVIGNIEEKNEVLVYTSDSDSEDIVRIDELLKSNSYVSSVVFYSKEEAWEDQKIKMEGYSELFDAVTVNPMPDTFRVTINDLTKIEEAVEQFSSIEGVESVSAPYDFASLLVSMRTTLTVIAASVLVALVIVCIVIVYNSARTSVFARRKEIGIMKSVGATNSFIKFPFFIEGMFIGIIAGLASWFLTKIAYEALISFFSEDITIWQILGLVNVIQFSEVTWIVLGLNCLTGAILGALGTVFSMGKHLKV